MTSANVSKYVPYALYRETIDTALYSTITPEVNTAQTYVMASVPAGNDGDIYIRYMGAVVKESWAKTGRNGYSIKYTVTGDQLAAAGLFNDTVGTTSVWSTYQRIGSVYTGFDTVVVPTLSAPYGYILPATTHTGYNNVDGNTFGTQVTISGNTSSTTPLHSLSRMEHHSGI